MTPRLFVRDEAAADLEEAAEWYETRRAGLGGAFLRTVRALLAGIARAPLAYVVFFVVEPDHVEVLAVLHGRRDPRVWQSRA